MHYVKKFDKFARISHQPYRRRPYHSFHEISLSSRGRLADRRARGDDEERGERGVAAAGGEEAWALSDSRGRGREGKGKGKGKGILVRGRVRGEAYKNVAT